MAFDDPVSAWLQMAQNKNQNRRQMYGDIAGLGQGLGQGLASIGDIIGEQKKKALLAQIVQAMQTQGAPQQGPPLPGMGQAQGIPSPASGMGGPAQDNTQQLKGLMMQADPQGMMGAMEGQMFQTPDQKAQADYLRWKMTQGNQQKPEFSPVSGMLSPTGTILEMDKFTGKVKDTGSKGVSQGYGAMMGPIRKGQYTIQDLPSNQGPSTASGAAYQVKVGARQGKALIAQPGSKFRTSLASGDIARSINRVAPTDEAMKNAGFSDTLINRWANLKTSITADPTTLENPKMRKEMYDILDDMDKSATPFIQNQLDDMADTGFQVTPATRKRQLGETLPNIPFQEGPQMPGQQPTQGGWGIQKVQ